MFSSLSRWFRGCPRTVSKRAGRKKTYKPHLEALEDRCVPTAGVLDPTFGAGGIVTTSGVRADGDVAVAVRADGKVIAVGAASNDFAVVRYNSNGSLDTSLSGDGIATTDFNGNRDMTRAVAIVGDKTLVVGRARRSGNNTALGDIALARYNNDGSLDKTFDKDGKVTTSFGTWINSSAAGVAVQADGKIVVAGSNNDTRQTFNPSYFTVVRYNSNGSLDTSFGSGGKAVFTNIIGGGGDIALLAGGKMVIGYGFAAVRLNANGSLDTSFGSGGIASTSIPGAETSAGQAMAMQPDGSIVCVGSAYFADATTTFQVAAVRYDANGSLDSSFDGDGIVTVNIYNAPTLEWNEQGNAVAIQGDGKILIAGHAGTLNYNFMLMRLNSNGSLDTSFGTNGHVETSMGNNGFGTEAYALALQSDGKAVLAGVAAGQLTLDRYLMAAPQIGSFTANPNPVTSGSSTTLTASGITDANPGSSIIQVAFYVDSNNDGKLDAGEVVGYGTQTSPGVWSFDFTVNLAAGSYTLFAQAEDSYGVFGDPLALSLSVV